VKDEGLKVDWLIETHAHADHLSGSPYIKDKVGGKIGIGEHITAVYNIFYTQRHLISRPTIKLGPREIMEPMK
jgi:glyoxylase-like metal-dependent hydrolase (beta-lactamase superfamily II)